MNRQDRDRGAKMKLTENQELGSRDKVRGIRRSDQLYVARMMLVVVRG